MSNNGKKNPILFFFQESWLLMVASIIFGCLLSSLNMAWGPKIAENQKGKFAQLAGGLITEAKTFEPATDATIEQAGGEAILVQVQKGLDANGNITGFVFECQGGGYGGTIKLLVGVDAKFEKIMGFGVLESSETPGFGDKIKIKDGFYQAQYKGAPVTQLILTKGGDDEKAKVIDNEIIAITGATVTSSAVVDIFNAYLVPLKEKVAAAGLLTEK